MVKGLYVEAEEIVREYYEKGVHFYYICGGRGIGKTYGALDLCKKVGTGEFTLFTEEPMKFLYLRRTAVEAQSIAAPESCPFKKYNAGEGVEITADFAAKLGFGEFYMEGYENSIGYAAALSTFDNLTGVDFSDVSLIFYDECLPRNRNKSPLKREGFIFLNMIETINRNRGIEGLPEVVVIMLSNPIDLSSPFLSQLNITPVLNSMIFKNQQKYTDYSRSLHIEKFKEHRVSEMKRDSVLYKFAKGTGFDEESLSGDFVNNDITRIEKPDLVEYKPYLTLENICVYKHKSEEKWHISQTVQPAKYVFRVYEREKFRTIFYWKYKLLDIDRLVTYDNFNTKVVFEEMINYKSL